MELAQLPDDYEEPTVPWDGEDGVQMSTADGYGMSMEQSGESVTLEEYEASQAASEQSVVDPAWAAEQAAKEAAAKAADDKGIWGSVKSFFS